MNSWIGAALLGPFSTLMVRTVIGSFFLVSVSITLTTLRSYSPIATGSGSFVFLRSILTNDIRPPFTIQQCADAILGGSVIEPWDRHIFEGLQARDRRPYVLETLWIRFGPYFMDYSPLVIILRHCLEHIGELQRYNSSSPSRQVYLGLDLLRLLILIHREVGGAVHVQRGTC